MAMLPYRVVYADTDAGGVVYHGRYFEMAERSRIEAFSVLCVNILELQKRFQILLVVRQAQAVFRRPALLGDNLTFSTSVVGLTPARVNLKTVISRGVDDLCIVTVELACIDASSKTTCLLPTELADLLNTPSHLSAAEDATGPKNRYGRSMKRPFWKKVLVAAVCICGSYQAMAGELAVTRTTIRDAFERAETDPGAINDAMDTADALLADHPGDPVVMSYRGGLLGMKARDTSLPWRKIDYAEQSIAVLDEVFQRRSGTAFADPASELTVLMVRGLTFANFPSFLGRSDAALQALTEATRHPDFAQVKQEDRAMVLAWMSVITVRKGNDTAAQQLLAQAEELDRRISQSVWKQR